MLVLYMVLAIVAGFVVVMSALGGDGESDASMDSELGGEADIDFTTATSMSQIGDAPAGDVLQGTLSAFLSMRFWTYVLAGFGLTGSILTLFNVSAEPIRALTSLAVGVATGFSVSLLTRLIVNSQHDSMISAGDFIGAMGKVTLPVRGEGEIGKVRLNVRGDLVDILAVSSNGTAIDAQQEIVVVGLNGNKAVIAPADELIGDSPHQIE